MAVFLLNNYNPIRTFEKNTIMSKDKKGIYTGIIEMARHAGPEDCEMCGS